MILDSQALKRVLFSVLFGTFAILVISIPQVASADSVRWKPWGAANNFHGGNLSMTNNFLVRCLYPAYQNLPTVLFLGELDTNGNTPDGFSSEVVFYFKDLIHLDQIIPNPGQVDFWFDISSIQLEPGKRYAVQCGRDVPQSSTLPDHWFLSNAGAFIVME